MINVLIQTAAWLCLVAWVISFAKMMLIVDEQTRGDYLRLNSEFDYFILRRKVKVWFISWVGFSAYIWWAWL